MADAFIGEIRIFSGNYAPYGWALCNGQLMPIAQNAALFSILGTQYGGNGSNDFALPNLNGAAPMHGGSGAGLTTRHIGEKVGAESVTLTAAEMPSHTHAAQAYEIPGTSTHPSNNYWAEAPAQGRPHPQQAPIYSTNANVTMHPSSLSTTGGNQPHNNMQPFIALNFIICLNGIYPARG
ncbi:Microcystin-dependent protein [Paenibacillus sp. 1_12]|uniref:phage tail protein n=1 Tax=Paenibacillus sp. 1_12 TaxID=1566278 RepID=UPI0008E5F32E|nr:tail fiber protein [Paenibacillus sp. 1_12]SFL21253.1 Microcystin-dependent protein [Paenibacillus sp. 1_12]